MSLLSQGNPLDEGVSEVIKAFLEKALQIPGVTFEAIDALHSPAEVVNSFKELLLAGVSEVPCLSVSVVSLIKLFAFDALPVSCYMIYICKYFFRMTLRVNLLTQDLLHH